jgi:hypothetical protein
MVGSILLLCLNTDEALTGTLTGTPTTISEQPKTATDVKPLWKPQEGRPGTSKNKTDRIPLRHCVPLNNTLVVIGSIICCNCKVILPIFFYNFTLPKINGKKSPYDTLLFSPNFLNVSCYTASAPGSFIDPGFARSSLTCS